MVKPKRYGLACPLKGGKYPIALLGHRQFSPEIIWIAAAWGFYHFKKLTKALYYS